MASLIKPSPLTCTKRAIQRLPRVKTYLNQGLLNRWTSQYDCGITAGGLTFNLNNGTKNPLIIVKNLENTFLGMKKGKSLANFDISNALCEN